MAGTQAPLPLGQLPIDRDCGQAGVYATPSGEPPDATIALTAQRCYFTRFTVSRVVNAASLALGVTTAAGAADTASLGIYTVDDDRGHVSLAASVTGVVLNAGGPQFGALASLYQLVPRTIYYGAVLCAAIGGTAASVSGKAFGAAGCSTLFHATASSTVFVPGITESQLLNGQATLPGQVASASFSGAGSTNAVLAVREY